MNIISEIDLYKYVFYPEKLSDEKKQIISNNIEKYGDDLNKLSEFKKNMEIELSDNILDRIYDKIEAYNQEGQIVLNKVEINDEFTEVSIAAASGENKIFPHTNTFIDNNRSFIAKVISDDNSNKIYIFAKDDRIFEIKLTLYPSNEDYYTNIEDLPLILKPYQSINKIEISVC